MEDIISAFRHFEIADHYLARLVAGVDQTARVVVCDLAEVAEGRDDIFHIAFCLDQTLAGVESFSTRKFVFALPNALGNSQQEVTAFGGRLICPDTGFKSGACRSDGTFGVFGGCFGDNTDFTAVCWAIDGAGGLV